MTTREKVVAAAFTAARHFAPLTVEYRRGADTVTVPAFVLTSEDQSVLQAGEVTISSDACFVIEATSIASFVKPERTDMLTITDGANQRRYSIMAESGRPVWSLWNDDRRYWKIWTKEINRE